MVHYGVPNSPEMYLQETGRAGRDGEFANAIILRHSHTLSGSHVSQDMKDYINSKTCRREFLLQIFNIKPEMTGHFDCCDICASSYSCCSCGVNAKCNHSKQACYCVPFCKQPINLVQSVDVELVELRPTLDNDNQAELRNRIAALAEARITVPSNVNPIYPELIDKVVDNYVYIAAASDILKLGAFSMTDADDIFSIVEEFDCLCL